MQCFESVAAKRFWGATARPSDAVAVRRRFGAASDAVGRGLDAHVAEVDLGLAAVMGNVYIHGEQDFASEETAVGRIVDFAELLVSQVGDYGGAIFEGAAQEFDDGVFVLVVGDRRARRVGVI